MLRRSLGHPQQHASPQEVCAPPTRSRLKENLRYCQRTQVQQRPGQGRHHRLHHRHFPPPLRARLCPRCELSNVNICVIIIIIIFKLRTLKMLNWSPFLVCASRDESARNRMWIRSGGKELGALKRNVM